MRRWRWVLGVAIVALVIAAAYVAGITPQGQRTARAANEADNATYAYEAHDVVVRQMDAQGQLQYQLQAESVTQLPKNGVVTVNDLTMHYDPSGGKDESRRWTPTAQSASLPEDSDIVVLQGRVLVRGRMQPSSGLMTFSTGSLDYNLKTQDLHNKAPFELHWGGSRFKGSGLKANIKQGTVSVESTTNGQIAP
jgi:lipopolysaccharide export system protein LptC